MQLGTWGGAWTSCHDGGAGGCRCYLLSSGLWLYKLPAPPLLISHPAFNSRPLETSTFLIDTSSTMDEKNDFTTNGASAEHTTVAVPATQDANLVAGLQTTDDVNAIEAPVTWQAYLICAFASFGGIFFGYDSGYINGVTGSRVFIDMVAGKGAESLSSPDNSLIVSILSAGTFFGALIAGDIAERIGRKWTVIAGCGIYLFGCAIQMITGHGDALGAIVAGRLIAGFGVGFESAIVILYMSEIVSIIPTLNSCVILC